MFFALVLALFLSLSAHADNPTLHITHHVSGNPDATPILLVHGLAHNQSHWPQEFIDSLDGDVYTLSLRGHGYSSQGDIPLWRTGKKAYVEDIDQVIDQIGEPVILVGHSMAGYVVQHYAQDHGDKLAGLVIMSPPGPHGAWLPTGRLVIHHPLVLAKMVVTMDSGYYLKPHDICHDHLFHPGISMEDTVDHCASMASESFLIFPQMLLQPPRARLIKKYHLPVLVMSGDLDRIFHPQEVGRVAKAYGVIHHRFPDMSHTLMAEDGWQEVANTISLFVWTIDQAEE